MLPLKLYISVAVVGGLTDLSLNKYLSNTKPTGEVSKALKGFYANINPVKSVLVASATFVGVLLIADLIVNKLNKK